MQNNGLNGSELHRLTEFTHYDPKQFNRIYKKCRPLMKKLVKQVDARRYNVTEDVIFSYFEDKFLFVYNKYQDQYDEERLKATILSSLSIFKNKLLRSAYSQQAEFNQDLASFEDIHESGKEWVDDKDEVEMREDIHHRFHQYMQDHLTPDEYLVFVTQLDPPPYIKERMTQGRVSVEHLIDFFGLPRNKRSVTMITEYRHHIKEVLAQAEKEFHR